MAGTGSRNIRNNKKKSHNRKKMRLGANLVLVGALVILAVFGVKSYRNYQKIQENKAKQAELQEELASEEARSKEIDAYEDYVGTDEYIEQIAKERLGLAYPNEIVFRPED